MISLSKHHAHGLAREQADKHRKPFLVLREHLSDPDLFFYSIVPADQVRPFEIIVGREEVAA